MTWNHIWNRLKAVPIGLWAALGAALALFVMYLRGRRLEAELAAAKLKSHAADAAAKSASSEGRAQVHLEVANKHNARVEELQDKYLALLSVGKETEKHIAALPPDEVTNEYLQLAAQAKADLDAAN